MQSAALTIGKLMMQHPQQASSMMGMMGGANSGGLSGLASSTSFLCLSYCKDMSSYLWLVAKMFAK